MIDDIIYHYRKLIRIYSVAYPHSINELEKSFKITYSTSFKACVGIIYLLFLKMKRENSFIFESLRNQEIIDLLPKEQIMILGGKNERRECLDKGYRFFWIGGIVAAVILAGEKNVLFPLRITIWVCKLKLKNLRTYFMLYEDTLPVGLFFALLGNNCGQQTISIQHGFCTEGELFFDGHLCKFNLSYSKTQAKFIKGKESTFLELGPPFDIKYPIETSNEVILVGTGWKGLLPGFYDNSLKDFRRIQSILVPQGWRVFYRPHPNENEADYLAFFPEIDRRSKIDCLSNTKKVFIGYISSLLYEAKVFGHGVININDQDMPELAFTTHLKLDKANFNKIDGDIGTVHQRILEENVDVLPTLETRFFSVFNEIAYR